MTVPVGRLRLVEGFGEVKAGRSSCASVPGCKDDGAGGDGGCVRDTGVVDPRLCIGAPEALCVAFGWVASSVNHIGWYRLRAIVARMRWRVRRCVWGCRMIFHMHGDS